MVPVTRMWGAFIAEFARTGNAVEAARYANAAAAISTMKMGPSESPPDSTIRSFLAQKFGVAAGQIRSAAESIRFSRTVAARTF